LILHWCTPSFAVRASGTIDSGTFAVAAQLCSIAGLEYCSCFQRHGSTVHCSLDLVGHESKYSTTVTSSRFPEVLNALLRTAAC
jgi:hypothetical protein